MDIEERLSHLEGRLRKAEDHLAILNLLNAYGPLADSGSATATADLWVKGGGYSFSGGVGDGSRVEAPAGLIGVYEADWHQELIHTGSAHLTATPTVHITDDDADALAYSFVIRREDERWILLRAAINHWTLRRTDAGWRVVDRVNRLLDGSPASHDLMSLAHP
ncbi:nuclear transport factor 2 family protein [Microbacterium sp. NPDC055357]